jgi:type IV pilus assembly protein PilY1
MTNSLQRTRRQAHGVRNAAFAAATLFAAFAVHATAPSTAPQVLLAITNSESMDGTTAGAIMVGSGGLASGYSTLNSSSSPLNYTIPSGFTPPVNAGSGGSAPYTANCLTNSSYKCDNSQSRLNMTKAAIQQVLTNYGSSINFGLYTYASSSGGAPSASLYTTWVYYMSPSSSGFTYTNTSSSTTVANPCYNYSSASANISGPCTSIATTSGTGVNAATLSGNRYINIGASSDNPQINDVLYAGSGLPGAFLTYGAVNPTNPYTQYTLSRYNTNIGSYSETYSNSAPCAVSGCQWTTTPTNAGYVPFSPQVLYAERGFGYGGSQSATTGYAAVAMNTDAASSLFTNALNPETNNSSTAEIKSFAGQSGIYALMNGAKTYLGGISHGTCQPQYVVLLTDGLPTLDHSGNAWPPLGTTTGNAYSLTASYNANGSFASSNSLAVTDAINAITALNAAGIKVYVIGLGAGVDPSVNSQAAALLTAMAIAGGTTNYFAAGDSDSLNNAFLSIIDQIYSENALSAPVAPISVSSGSAFQYELTSIPAPVAGHVKAYAVSANGVPSSSATWDAGTLMNTTNRGSALMGAKTDNTFTTLANLDAAVWNLTTTACVPNTATIVSYTINPSYSGTCSYLGTRQANWYLGNFSTQNTGHYVGPPASSMLIQRYATYLAYARANASRTPMLMFTNDDGFLYSVTASTGALRWGWASRNLLAKMQNYSTFPGTNATDGGFAVVDAMDSGAAWGSYVVGSLQGGAEHFVFKLDATGAPTRMVYDAVVGGGTVAGDTAAATGNGPLRQPPVIAYIGNNAFMVYIITVGTTSTLYETNIASGATTSSALGFQVSTALSLDIVSNRIWLGGANGSLWQIQLSTGTAATDAASIQRTGTLVNPATGVTITNPLYVGYVESYGAPHFYAVSSSVLEVFYVTSTGWTPEWATTTSAGYRYTASTSTWSTVAGANTLNANSVVSDFPLLLGTALLVPVYVPGTGCSQGTGYYDYFGLDTGKFPTDPVISQNGQQVTGNMVAGAGPAFTPSVSFTSTGIVLNNGSQGCTSNCNTQNLANSYPTSPFSWRQH